jgi:hypothetical protein
MSESGSAAVASLPTGMDPSIHSDVFARYERGVLEIEHRVDDTRQVQSLHKEPFKRSAESYTRGSPAFQKD